MSALEPFALPPDVVIQPIARLPRELRVRVEREAGDHSVTRPGARAMSSVVDAATAALLERFRVPSTIVDAVISFSAAEGRDPRSTLEEAFGVLSGFINDGLLVAASSELARPIATSLAAGDRVGDFEILEPVYLMADTEVYRARTRAGAAAALKISPAARRAAGNGRPSPGRRLSSAASTDG